MFQFILIPDGDMANRLARPSQESVGIRQQSAAVESQVHVCFVGHDVTKSILERFPGKRESNRQGVSSGEGFDRLRRFFQNRFAQRQRQI